MPASPGAACGQIVLSSDYAETIARTNKVILVRNETNPEDIGGINVATGILTSRGGMTSHAAVVARGMGKPCITGASEILINNKNSTIKINDITLLEGEYITIDGSSGEVFLGKVDTIQTEVDGYFKDLIDISEKLTSIKVRANAEIIRDAKVAKTFKSDGIGLCRTEHMFFQPDRLNIFQRMILSVNKKERTNILNELIPFQQEDFYQLFKIMDGKPVTIRLLDPPLHEFLPEKKNREKLFSLKQLMSIKTQEILERINSLEELNPMLGHRGCRLAITYPEIYQMQVKAILSAVYKCMKANIRIFPEIMVPLIINQQEFLEVKNLIKNTAQILERALNVKFQYKIGSMIELPAAVFNSGEIAKEADFISFGTNDLTQMCLGISRDDSNRFLREYIRKNIFKKDPFISIDQSTVGELLKIAIFNSKKANPKIKIGVCGEHAGDPESIKFFSNLQLDYISCSSFRIPIAKIAIGKYNPGNKIKN